VKTSTLNLPFSFTAFTLSSMIGILGYGCSTSGLKCRDRAAWQVLRKQILKSTGKDLSTNRESSVKEVRVCLLNLSVVWAFLQ